MRGILTLLFIAIGLALPAATQSPFAVHDIDGRLQTPLAPGAGTTNVLFFVTVDCPISNRYAPEIGRIATEYAPKGVRAFLIYANPALDAAAVRAHLSSYHARVAVPAIIDTAFALTSAAGANVTPEVAVYTSEGRRYRGRIDDWYVALGQNRRAATRHDLRLSLDAILAGRPVPMKETSAVGCYIEKRTGA